jgi:hypothetical protein
VPNLSFLVRENHYEYELHLVLQLASDEESASTW